MVVKVFILCFNSLAGVKTWIKTRWRTEINTRIRDDPILPTVIFISRERQQALPSHLSLLSAEGEVRMSPQIQFNSATQIIFTSAIMLCLFLSSLLFFYGATDKVSASQEIWRHFRDLSLFAAGYYFNNSVSNRYNCEESKLE